jgi:hypothetical protein
MAILGRTILLRYNNYQRVELTPQEQEKLMDELLEHNYKEMKRIRNFMLVKQEGDAEIFKTLCDKQLIMAFTAWTNSLEDKIHGIKSRFNKPMTREKEEEIKKNVEKGLGLKPKDEGKDGLEPKSQDQVLSE